MGSTLSVKKKRGLPGQDCQIHGCYIHTHQSAADKAHTHYFPSGLQAKDCGQLSKTLKVAQLALQASAFPNSVLGRFGKNISGLINTKISVD